MIEPDLLGGTCPNRGCMPKKVLVAAAHALDEIERAKAHHISVGKPSLDWAALIDREKAMIAGIPGSLADLMNRRGVEVIRDRGRFAGPNAIAVDGEILEAKHIVIATGSKPRRLPFPGAELMITSDDVLSERTLPASVVFVGGGVIALEFSHVYARAGIRVSGRVPPSTLARAAGVHRRATLLGRRRVLRKIKRSMRLGPARNGIGK
jgi:glutathione reductase (NADPH)